MNKVDHGLELGSVYDRTFGSFTSQPNQRDLLLELELWLLAMQVSIYIILKYFEKIKHMHLDF